MKRDVRIVLMMPPHARLDLDQLSGRERNVVDLAVSGHTDEQIAQALDLSPSTVNSYWVRIRGKIGQLSRTEIVGGVLRTQMAREQAALQAENVALKEDLRAASAARALAEDALAAAGGAPWPFLALESLPCAALVGEAPGTIIYANRQARDFLRSTGGDLVGRPVWELTLSEDRDEWETTVREFFAAPRTRPASAGLEKPHYVVRGDGTNVRATVAAEAFETPVGTMGVVVLREYLDELDTLVRALRRPLDFRLV